MHLESYELIYGDSYTSYSFISEGRKGKFKKIIQFQKLNSQHFYNLAFGDENTFNKEIDDMAVTNNGDMDKVLATVAKAVYHFTLVQPGAHIYIEGSTPARTRLYQISISRFLDVLAEDFEVFGKSESEWISYIKTLRYTAFIVRRKMYF